MKLYGHPISGNAHRVHNFLTLLGLEHEYEVVDLPNGAHKAPEFIAMNPLGQVPVLVDGDVTLRDSTAILLYLARTYDKTNAWLPTDIVAQAHVQEWLATSVNEISKGPFVVRLVKLLGAPLDYDTAKTVTLGLFDNLFEPHLGSNDWLVGDAPTIADIACYSYIACVEDGEIDMAPYPAIRAWLARCEAIEGFQRMPSGPELLGKA